MFVELIHLCLNIPLKNINPFSDFRRQISDAIKEIRDAKTLQNEVLHDSFCDFYSYNCENLIS